MSTERTLSSEIAQQYAVSLQNLDTLLDRAARQMARTKPYRPCFASTEAFDKAQAEYVQRVSLLDMLRNKVLRTTIEMM